MATDAPLQNRRLDVASSIVLTLALSAFALMVFTQDPVVSVILVASGMVLTGTALNLRIRFKKYEQKGVSDVH